MGHSKAEKTETHKRIVKIASKRFREDGLAGVGISELMKEAGLTVGGFYKHFDSRDDLVAEAVSSAFGGWKRRVDAAASGGLAVSYAKLIDEYLNEAHRDNPGAGCAFSALAAEIARSDKRTRALASEQLENDLQEVVDGCKSRRHKPIIVELPVLIAVGAIPVIRVVAPLVSETYGDPVPSKRPHFLDQPVVQLLAPLARKKSNDFVSSVDELRSVPPA